MNMPSFNSQLTMSSREIAELVESRHSDVCRSIERLISTDVIEGYTPMAYTHEQNGRQYHEFLIGKRDSYVVVAQLSPEFTARLVDRWQELESGAPVLNDLTVSAYLQVRKAHLERLEREAAQIKSLLFFDDAKDETVDNQWRMGNAAELTAVKDALERRLKSGAGKISVSQLRDNIKNLKAFNGVVKLTNRLKNELLPRLAEDGYCVLDNNTIHINP